VVAQYTAVLFNVVVLAATAVVAFAAGRSLSSRGRSSARDPRPILPSVTARSATARAAAVLPVAVPAGLGRPGRPTPHGRPTLYARSTAPPPRPHPTLLHAALSAHLDAVARSVTADSTRAAAPGRLVSIRRPTPIPRRPSHVCPHGRYPT
jgi:hypothetical protein